jgi:tight adherence protein C
MRALPLALGAATTGALLAASSARPTLRRARAGRRRADGAEAGAAVDAFGIAPAVPPAGSAAALDAPSRPTAVRAGAAALGRAARRVARRPPDPATDARTGVAVACGVAAFAVSPAVGLLAVAAMLAHPVLRRHRCAAARARGVIHELPDVIDLCRIALDGGLTVHHALEAVVAHGSGVVIDELAAVLAQTRHGVRLGDALVAARGLGPPAHAFVDTLVAAERYGASALAGLDRAATEARLVRRRQGEEAARRVPVTMLFPLVLCTLPALGLLTVLPLVARSLPSLAP